jgi:hypothetical protein
MATHERVSTGTRIEKQRTFENDKHRIVAEYYGDGRVVLVGLTSMGRQSSQPFMNEQQFDEWLASFGKARQYREITSDSTTAAPALIDPPTPPAKARKHAAGRAMFSDGQFATLVISYEQWRRNSARLYDGPEDLDFQRAFRSKFGISWDVWNRELELRGMAEPPATDVREDVVAEAEAGIAEAIAAEDPVRRNPAIAEVNAEQHRKRAEAAAVKLSRTAS